MISRRTFIESGLSAAALVGCPALTQSETLNLLIVDPALVLTAPPRGAIAVSGPALLEAILPRMERWQRIDAFVGEADVRLLAELVRFETGLRWTTTVLEAGSGTIVGCLRRPAQMVIVTRAQQRRLPLGHV